MMFGAFGGTSFAGVVLVLIGIVVIGLLIVWCIPQQSNKESKSMDLTDDEFDTEKIKARNAERGMNIEANNENLYAVEADDAFASMAAKDADDAKVAKAFDEVREILEKAAWADAMVEVNTMQETRELEKVFQAAIAAEQAKATEHAKSMGEAAQEVAEQAKTLEEAKAVEEAAEHTKALEEAKAAEEAAEHARALEEARAAEEAAEQTKAAEEAAEQARALEQAKAAEKAAEQAKAAEEAAEQARTLEEAKAAEKAAEQAKALEKARAAEEAAEQARALEEARAAEEAAKQTRAFEEAKAAEEAAKQARALEEAKAAEEAAEQARALEEATEQAKALEEAKAAEEAAEQAKALEDAKAVEQAVEAAKAAEEVAQNAKALEEAKAAAEAAKQAEALEEARAAEEAAEQDKVLWEAKAAAKAIEVEKAVKLLEEAPRADGDAKISSLLQLPPTLNNSARSRMQTVLESKRVEVATMVHFKKEIEFQSVKPLDEPVAQFADSNSARLHLADVAEIMRICSAVNLLIEGCVVTSTTPTTSGLNEWAQKLALNQAKLLQSELVALGIDQQRLDVRGLPMGTGQARSDVVLKLVAAPAATDAIGALQASALVLDEEAETQLDKVLRRDLVGVATMIQVKSEALDFRPVNRKFPPVAKFRSRENAMQVIQDVVELLQIYDTASVLIEGHTATPADKIDEWAHKLAVGRADLVKASIVELGIDSNRLSTIGLPGNLGCNRSILKIRITDF